MTSLLDAYEVLKSTNAPDRSDKNEDDNSSVNKKSKIETNEVKTYESTSRKDRAEFRVRLFKIILKRIKRWTPFLSGLVVIILVVIFIPTGPAFDANKIKLGINARSISWDQSDTYLMNEFRNELNSELKAKNTKYQLSTSSVQYFEDRGTDLSKLSSSLKNGHIDILGELSPREIFILNESVNLSPFIGPKHTVGGSSSTNYRTILFGLSETYPESEGRRPDILVQEILNNKKLAVSGKDSTSGYWWPRYWLLNRLQDRKIDLSFEESSNIQSSSFDIIKKVMCDPGNVTAGALAEFRYLKYVDKNGQLLDDVLREKVLSCGASTNATLRVIKKLDRIPNGAYVLSPVAAMQPQLANDLNDVWNTAIQNIYKRADACEGESGNCDLILQSGRKIDTKKFKYYLPEQWLTRGLQTYIDGIAGKVFSADDPKTQQKSRMVYFLLLICTVILVFGLTAATLLRRSQSAESNES